MKYSSIVLVAVMVIVFAMQSVIPSLTDEFVMVSSDISSRPWILFTSVFLHGSLSHLFSNMFVLGLFGLLLENIIGTKRFLILFVFAGILASLGSSLLYDAALGASGAIFGLLGALATLRPRMTVWALGVPMPMIAAAGFYLLLDLGGLFFPSNIANFAHIIGLFAGVAFGMLMRKHFIEEKKRNVVSDNDIERWEESYM